MSVNEINFKLSKETQEYKNFIEWFIGFSEGNGSWNVTNNSYQNRVCFFINQKDPKVLYKIKKHLGFGSVTGPYKNNTKSTYFRYSVINQTHVRELIKIFNGRLVLKKTKKRFEDYLNAYNSLHMTRQALSSIEFKDNFVLPTLQDGWLSGFLDAEGCFSGTARTDWSKVILTISLVQKEEKEIFKHLKSILGGSLNLKEKQGMIFRLKINSIEDRERVIKYLDKYNLRSTKHIAFCRFKKIHIRLTDGKFKWRMLSLRAKERLKRLVKDINNI